MSMLDRLRRTTPGRLVLATALLVVLGLAFGVTGVVTVQRRAALVEDVGTVSGPLSAHAQLLYRSLSDADATAATAFLAGGTEPAALRQRYLDDIAAATDALAAAQRGADGETAALLTSIGRELPVYTGLVETARAYNRQGTPLGGAYLREASFHLRATVLPAASRVYDLEQGRLGAAQDRAGGFPWALLLLGVLLVGALVLVQVRLSRLTHRVLNVPLVAATALAVVACGWLTIAVGRAADEVSDGRTEGSATAHLLASARAEVLTMRANESLTLVARGDGGRFEEAVVTGYTKLADPATPDLLDQARAQSFSTDDRRAVDEARRIADEWMAGHRAVRQLDAEGRYTDAVALATGDGPTDQAAIFNRLETTLNGALDGAEDRFEARTAAARSALRGADIAVGVLTLLLLAGAVTGLARRIGEYR